jgi:hypothetical protein
MNNTITINQAARELGNVKSAPIIDQSTRDSAQWAELILAELRQQVGLDWNASMADLYHAVVKLRE